MTTFPRYGIFGSGRYLRPHNTLAKPLSFTDDTVYFNEAFEPTTAELDKMDKIAIAVTSGGQGDTRQGFTEIMIFDASNYDADEQKATSVDRGVIPYGETITTSALFTGEHPAGSRVEIIGMVPQLWNAFLAWLHKEDAGLEYNMGALMGTNLNGYYTFHIGTNDVWAATNISRNADNANLWESSDANWGILYQLPALDTTANDALLFNETKITVLDFAAAAINGVTGDRFWGFDSAAAGIAWNSVTRRRVGFALNGGTLYAITYSPSSLTSTDISSGITVTDLHAYRIIYNPADESVKFYVDGVEKAEITTNIPDDSSDMAIGISGTVNGEDVIFTGATITQEL